MTDRTPASPVEHARDDVIRSAYGRCWTPICPSKHVDDAPDCLEAALDRYAAALQAQDHTDTKGGLDVERLARALEPAFGPSFFPGLTDVTVFGKTPLEVAQAIATEYDRAALEPTHD